MKKFCESLSGHAENTNDFEKKKITKITSRCKGVLQFWKKNLRSSLKV